MLLAYHQLKMTSVIYLMNISNIPIVIFVFWPNKNWFNSRLVTPRPVPSCQILSPRRSEKIRELCAAGFAVGSATSFSLCTWHIMAHHGTSLHLPPVRLFACSPASVSEHLFWSHASPQVFRALGMPLASFGSTKNVGLKIMN